MITRVRSYQTTDYLFAVNDLREFGNYVGHHGLVMENGLPTEATLKIRRPNGYVYDLVNHRNLESKDADGMIEIDAKFGPCDGNLFMITDRPIAEVEVKTVEQTKPGQQVRISIRVLDDSEQLIDAVVPIKVELLDPHGRPAEFSGYYGAKGGQVQVNADIAANDVPGIWTIRATELASGLADSAHIRMRGE